MNTTAISAAGELARAVRSLMDGECLPNPESAAFDALSGQIRTFLAAASVDDRARLGDLVLGALIDVGRAHIAAHSALGDIGRAP